MARPPRLRKARNLVTKTLSWSQVLLSPLKEREQAPRLKRWVDQRDPPYGGMPRRGAGPSLSPIYHHWLTPQPAGWLVDILNPSYTLDGEPGRLYVNPMWQVPQPFLGPDSRPMTQPIWDATTTKKSQTRLFRCMSGATTSGRGPGKVFTLPTLLLKACSSAPKNVPAPEKLSSSLY